MSNVSQEFLRIDKTETANRELRRENTSLRRISTVQQHDIGDLYEAVHRIEDRLDQIEKRLELRDFQEMAQSPFDAG